MAPLVAQPQNSWLTSQTSIKFKTYYYKLCYLSRKLDTNTMSNESDQFTSEKQELASLPYYNRSESSILTYFSLDSAFALFPCNEQGEVLSVLHWLTINNQYIHLSYQNNQILQCFYQALKQSGLSDQIPILSFGLDQQNFIDIQGRSGQTFYNAMINGRTTSLGINQINSLLTQKYEQEERRNNQDYSIEDKDIIQFYDMFQFFHDYNQQQNNQAQSPLNPMLYSQQLSDSQLSTEDSQQSQEQIQILPSQTSITQIQSQQYDNNMEMNILDQYQLVELRSWKKDIQKQYFGHKPHLMQYFKDQYPANYIQQSICTQNQQIPNINYELFKNLYIIPQMLKMKNNEEQICRISQLWKLLDQIPQQYLKLGKASESATFIFNIKKVISDIDCEQLKLQLMQQQNEDQLSLSLIFKNLIIKNQIFNSFLQNQNTKYKGECQGEMAIHFANCTYQTFDINDIDINESMIWLFNFAYQSKIYGNYLKQLETQIDNTIKSNIQNSFGDKDKCFIASGFVKNELIAQDIEILQNRQQLINKWLQQKQQSQNNNEKQQNVIQQKVKQIIKQIYDLQYNPFDLSDRIAQMISICPNDQQQWYLSSILQNLFNTIDQITDIIDLDNIQQIQFNINKQCIFQQRLQYLINLKRAQIIYQNDGHIISYIPQTFDQVKAIYTEYNNHGIKNLQQTSIYQCIVYNLINFQKDHDINSSTFTIQFLGYLQQIIGNDWPNSDKHVQYENKQQQQQDEKLYQMPTLIIYPFDNIFIQLLVKDIIKNKKQFQSLSPKSCQTKIIDNQQTLFKKNRQFIMEMDKQYIIYQLQLRAMISQHMEDILCLYQMFQKDNQNITEQQQNQLQQIFLEILNKKQDIQSMFSPQQETNQLLIKNHFDIQYLNSQQHKNIEQNMKIIHNFNVYIYNILYLKQYLGNQDFNYNDIIIMLNDLYLPDDYQREILYKKLQNNLTPHLWQVVLSSIAPGKLYLAFKDFKYNNKYQVIKAQVNKCIGISLLSSEYDLD